MDINDDALAAGSQRIRCLCAKGLPDVARSGSRVDPWSPASDNGEEMLLHQQQMLTQIGNPIKIVMNASSHGDAKQAVNSGPGLCF
ncbi:MAG TPA: hypothetical protein QF517_01995 [Pseudomonadales bacterium]|jgi:hypothetical protein|nr:hypothetical protein [Pseudomonadales bacterium]MDP7316352.1 hypothetical protein [Pseudomonadales bacterium]HJL60700.1 hypothetical protein [Pseudomonadales bacterium]HJP51488.1 hypothetical protein [Pseudomonadales bacterium]|tara:strand:+ start:497 stop:754 length:258 start_codon:yes stop_codon:yes gene_type:complete